MLLWRNKKKDVVGTHLKYLASSNEYHNICFSREIRKNKRLLVKKAHNWKLIMDNFLQFWVKTYFSINKELKKKKCPGIINKQWYFINCIIP